VRPTVSFGVRQKKTWSATPKIKRDNKGTNMNLQRKGNNGIRGGVLFKT
jgi:hypothetical protein